MISNQYQTGDLHNYNNNFKAGYSSQTFSPINGLSNGTYLKKKEQNNPPYYSVLPTRLTKQITSTHAKPLTRYDQFEMPNGFGKEQRNDNNGYIYPQHSVGQSPLRAASGLILQNLVTNQTDPNSEKLLPGHLTSQARKQKAINFHYLDSQYSKKLHQPTSQTPHEHQVNMLQSLSKNNSIKPSKISHSAIEIIKNNPTASNNALKLSNNAISATHLPQIQPAKVSNKPWGNITSYAANTHNGIVRSYNEDRISIVLDLRKPGNKSLSSTPQTKKVSFFAVFDGHGGSACAEFLRDQLHQYVATQDCFPNDPEQAIIQGFKQAEDDFMKQNSSLLVEKSGSCACVCLIVDDQIYVANVGDSRAILSLNTGSQSASLSFDHKPSEPKERKRIIEAGGQIYQNNQLITSLTDIGQINVGPMRVLPGRLSVSRTFGDAMAKLEQFGGNPNVVVATPEIQQFRYRENVHDFIIIASDGVFDRMSTEEAIQTIWSINTNQLKNSKSPPNVNEVCGEAVDRLMKTAMFKESMDNLSVVMICFKNFQKFIEGAANGLNLRSNSVQTHLIKDQQLLRQSHQGGLQSQMLQQENYNQGIGKVEPKNNRILQNQVVQMQQQSQMYNGIKQLNR